MKISNKKMFLVLLVFFISSMVLHAEDAQDVQQFQGFNLVGYTDGGEKSWDLNGDTAHIFGNLIKLTNVVAYAYGDEEVKLTAEKGSIQKETGQVHLDTDVVITTDTGIKMTTDSLDWERDNDLVSTDDEVVITNSEMRASGKGVVAHPDLKTAQMNEDIKVEINATPKEPQPQIVTITCDGPMEIDQNNNKAVFNKNVVAVEPMQDRKLKADKMEVFFNSEKKQIEKVICIGNVFVKQGDNLTYAERLVYDAATQKMTLEGRPKLIINPEAAKSVEF